MRRLAGVLGHAEVVEGRVAKAVLDDVVPGVERDPAPVDIPRHRRLVPVFLLVARGVELVPAPFQHAEPEPLARQRVGGERGGQPRPDDHRIEDLFTHQASP